MRRALLGFFIAAGTVLCLDIAILVFLGSESETAQGLLWLVNFPSLPCMFCCLGPPPLGDADGPWDRMALMVIVVGAAINWGAIGAIIGGLARDSRR
jgi:hypothetical protein